MLKHHHPTELVSTSKMCKSQETVIYEMACCRKEIFDDMASAPTFTATILEQQPYML